MRRAAAAWEHPLRLRLVIPSVVLLIGGCTAPVLQPALRMRADAATGIGDAVVFVARNEPLDAESPAGNALPRAEAVQLALRHDPRIQASVARLRAAQADARQARLLPNPVLSVMFRFPEGGGDPMIEAGLTADVVAVLTRPRRASAADHRLRAATAEALGSVLDTLAEVQQQYDAAQAADAQLGVLRERRAAAERLSVVTGGLVESGQARPVELLQAQAQVDELDAEIFEAVAERHHQRLALARMIGQPSAPAAWQLDKPESARAPAARTDATAEPAWVALALRQRPEVQAARWEMAAAGDDAALAPAALFEGSSLGVSAEYDQKWFTGPAAMFPLPLFDWGRDRQARVKAVRAEASHRFTLAGRKAVEDVRRALAELEAARAALDVVERRLVPRQRDRRERAQAAFESGSSGIAPVLLAEQEFQQAIGKEIALRQKAASALHRLHRAAGGPGAAASLERAAPAAPQSGTDQRSH